MNPAARDRRAIEAALLDFQLMPGKHSLALREPPLLFAAMPQVLHIAGGKFSAEDDAVPSPLVRQAARFFVRSALLQPGADHYALLGLPQSAQAQAIKDRYRQLMRLLHPDFAEGGELGEGPSWPADAAARINSAYEVLASPVLRRIYDEDHMAQKPRQRAAAAQRSSAHPRPAMRPVGTARAAGPARGKPTADPRGRLKKLAGIFGAAGSLALVGFVLAGGGDNEVLVRREQADTAGAASTAGADRPQPARHAAPAAAAMQQARAAPVALSQAALQAQEADGPAAPQARQTTTARAPAGITQPAQSTMQFTLAAIAPQGLPLAMPLQTSVSMPAQALAPVPMRTALAESESAAQPAGLSSLAAAQPAGLSAPPAGPAALTRPPVAEAEPMAPATVQRTAAAGPAVASAAPRAGLTLAQAHPMLTRILQNLESGNGDSLLPLLERDARNSPAAQSLVRHYASLVDGARPVRVANAHFKAEPHDGRLLVTGFVQLQVGDAGNKDLAVQAEFIARDGGVVLTRLARAAQDRQD